MSKIFAWLLPLLLIAQLYPGIAAAQQRDRSPSLNLGDAVVTGFSGIIAPDPAQPRPAGKSATDLTFINPDGASARVVRLTRPGFVWDGRLFAAPKNFDVLAKDVGQVFGVALDDQSPPNIYLAATSAFGLQLVGRTKDGMLERRKTGGPGTVWMKGQFGLDLQGDPGSIYKVDGVTGTVSLFAKVMLSGAPNPGPALGNLAYDPAHKQLLVSDLYTGMIHRFAIGDGSELGPPYDHGATGRLAAKLAPVPFNPGSRPNIELNGFDATNPGTWGFAPPERRVWGLTIHAGRLYYSVRNGAAKDGPQIWSVGIQQDGSFAGDSRWELDVQTPYPVSDIVFSVSGAMIVAQRAPLAASYDYSAFTQPGEPRVLRYRPKDRDDPPSVEMWKPIPDEYAVGFAGTYRNTNGGVDLDYGYDRNGMLSTADCDATLVVTGEKLRFDPALSAKLTPGGPMLVDGLQLGPASAVRDANAPPWTSYFIDYDDKFDDTAASGHLGGVRVYNMHCCAPMAAVIPSTNASGEQGGGIGTQVICAPPMVLIGGACVMPPPPPNVCRPPLVPGRLAGECICPPGSRLVDGVCRIRPPPECRPPLVPSVERDRCVCPEGTVLRGRRCVPPLECRQPMVPSASGRECVCPRGTVQRGKECVPPNQCRPPFVPNIRGTGCVCPQGTVQRGRECVRTPDCRPPMVPNADGTSCVCPRGTTLRDGECVKPNACQPPMVQGPGGQCACPAGTVLRGRECVRQAACNPPATLNRNGACACPPGMALRGNSCVQLNQNPRSPGLPPDNNPRGTTGGRNRPVGQP